MPRRYVLVLVALVLVTAPASSGLTDTIGPTHTGCLVTDRWGRIIFQKNHYVLFVSDKAAAQLEQYRGKLITIDAEIDRGRKPGSAMIKSVNKITVEEQAAGLELRLEAGEAASKEGEGVAAEIIVRNTSAEPITVSSHGDMILTTKSPFIKDPPSYKSAERDVTTYWQYYGVYHDQRQGRLSFACREDSLASYGVGPDELWKDPKIIRPAGEDGEMITIEPGATFRHPVRIGASLGWGEYEAFFVLGGIQSSRLSFDVMAEWQGPPPSLPRKKEGKP